MSARIEETIDFRGESCWPPALLILFFFIGLFLAPFNLAGQFKDVPPVYYAPDGKIFMRKSVAYSILALPQNNPASSAFPIGPQRTAKAFQLEEGPYKLGFESESGTSFQQEVLIDGTAPVSTLQFLKAPKSIQNGISWYGKNLSISITATDASSGVLQTIFFLNDSAPATYGGPVQSFTTDLSHEISYYTADNVGNRELERKASFSVDVTGPELTYRFTGPRFQNFLGPDAEIVVDARDNGSGVNRYFYKTRAGAFSQYRKPVSADSLPDGRYALVAYAIDNVENSGDTLKVPFIVDKTPPDLLASIEGRQVTKDGVAFIRSASKIKIESKDAGSGSAVTRFLINDAQELEYRQPFIVSSETGASVVEFFGDDRIGNRTEKKNIRVFVDETPPIASFDFPAGYFKEGNEIILNKGSNMVIEAADLESGVDKIEYRFGKDPWKPYSEPVMFNTVGKFILELRSIDLLGNTELPQVVQLKVQERRDLASSGQGAQTGSKDGALGELSYREDASGILTGAGDLPFYIWISDTPDGTGMQFLLSSKDTTARKNGRKFVADSEGMNRISVSMPGQRANFDVLVDKTPPVTQLKPNDAPVYVSGNRRYISNALEFSLIATDAISGVAAVMVSEDENKYQAGKTVFRNFTSERPYSVKYYAIDKVGNREKEKEFEFIIDATAPKSQHKLLKNFAGTSLAPETVIELSATDNLSGVGAIKFRFDNRPETDYKSNIKLGDIPGLEDGPHVLYYRSIDRVQNKEAERQFAFKIDSKKPEIQLEFAGRTYSREEKRIFTAEGATLVFKNPDPRKELRQIWFSKGGAERETFKTAVPLDGTAAYTIQYGAEDILGNQTPVFSISIIPDSKAPAISHALTGTQITAENGAVFLGPNSAFTLSATDDLSGVKTISYRIGGQPWKTYTGPSKIEVTGATEITYQAVDFLRNLAPSKSFKVINDLNAPDLEVSSTPPGVSGSDGSISIGAGTVIAIAASDALTDVKSIVFKINDQPEQPYIRPITSLPKGKVRISITVSDIVGNTRTEVKIFNVL